LIVHGDGSDVVTLHFRHVRGVVERPVGPIELVDAVPLSADPLIVLPVYGDGVDIVAFKAAKIGNIACPSAVIEAAHCGRVAYQVITPLIVSIGTPAKPFDIGAVYGDGPDVIAG